MNRMLILIVLLILLLIFLLALDQEFSSQSHLLDWYKLKTYNRTWDFRRLKKNSSVVQIICFLIKDCIRLLIHPLIIVYNLILKTSIFPDFWKITKGCFVHTIGEFNMNNNYRPIAILINVAKVFQIIVYNRIYLSARSIVSVSQHGFMISRSTISKLTIFSQYLCEN